MTRAWTAFALAMAIGAASAARADIVYTQNFDSMGQSGTAAPVGWSFLALSGSHDLFSFAGSSASITTTFLPNATSNAIVAGDGSSTLTSPTGTVTAVTGPTNQRAASAFNFGLTASPSDRCLGTSPTGIAMSELQLSLTNTDSAALNSVTVGYDIRRFSTTTANNSGYQGPAVGLEELPGYWLFYSLDGGTSWTNVAALNPTIAGPGGVVVPNSIGVTNVPATSFGLSSPWNAGATMLLRWVDDNAQSPSPDQIIGVDNVSVTATPAPGSVALLGAGAAVALRRRRR